MMQTTLNMVIPTFNFAESDPEPEVDILWENLTEYERKLRAMGFKESDFDTYNLTAGILGAVLLAVTVILVIQADIEDMRRSFRYWRENMSDFRYRLRELCHPNNRVHPSDP